MIRVKILLAMIGILLAVCLSAVGQSSSRAEFNSSFRQGFQGFQGGLSMPSSGLSGFGSQSAIAGQTARASQSANPLAVQGVSLSTRRSNMAGGGRIGMQKMPHTFSGLLRSGKGNANRQSGGAKMGQTRATQNRPGAMQPVFGGSSSVGSGGGGSSGAIDFTQGIASAASKKSVFGRRALGQTKNKLLSGRRGSLGSRLGGGKSYLTSGAGLGASRDNPFTSSGIRGGGAYNFLK